MGPNTAEEWDEYFKARGHHEEIRQHDFMRNERNAARESSLIKGRVERKRVAYNATDKPTTDIVMASIDWSHDPTSRELEAAFFRAIETVYNMGRP